MKIESVLFHEALEHAESFENALIFMKLLEAEECLEGTKLRVHAAVVQVDCGVHAGTESYNHTLAVVFLPCPVLVSAFMASTAAAHFFFLSLLGAGRGTFAFR